jgi:uncharacterized membrane protein
VTDEIGNYSVYSLKLDLVVREIKRSKGGGVLGIICEAFLYIVVVSLFLGMYQDRLCNITYVL